MDLTASLHRIRSSHPELAEGIAPLRTLEHVLNWLQQQDWPLQSLDMETQDEYCHDLLIPIPGSSDYLIYGMT